MYDPQPLSPHQSYSEAERPNVISLDEHPVALILSLGIGGVTVCLPCAPFAWFMGDSTLRRMERDGIYEGWERTMVQVGRNLGIIGTLALMLGVGIFLWINIAGIPSVVGTILILLILLILLFSPRADR